MLTTVENGMDWLAFENQQMSSERETKVGWFGEGRVFFPGSFLNSFGKRFVEPHANDTRHEDTYYSIIWMCILFTSFYIFYFIYTRSLNNSGSF